MDLVYLYGPPAVGKLSVAIEVAARTGYALFHNHLSIDCVAPIFEFGSEPFWRQVRSIREGILAEAAHEGRSVICTNVYSHPDSAPQIKRRFDIVEDCGGRVCPVQLSCSVEVLKERVVEERRKERGKIDTIAGLQKVLSEQDLLTPIPGREGLRVRTDVVSVGEAAERIIAWYRLATQSSSDGE